MYKMDFKSSQRLKTSLMYLSFTCACLIFILPFYFMVISSFKPGTDVIRNGLTFSIDLSTALAGTIRQQKFGAQHGLLKQAGGAARKPG